MSKNQKDANAGRVEPLAMLDKEATPPPAPAPMPRQTLVFWTPRLLLRTTLRAVTELRRPQRAVQRAAVSVRAADESR